MQKSKTYAIINVRRTGDGVNNKTNMLTCAYADMKKSVGVADGSGAS